MPTLYDYKNFDELDLKKRTGRMSQFAEVRSVQYNDGRAAGVHALDFKTGSGLDFTVLIDRCMDIYAATYRGIPLAWLSQAGVVSPAYYEPEGAGWLRSWGGGLLTTCGLEQAGAMSFDQGVNYGLHGRIGNLPAEKVQIAEHWEADNYMLTACGQVKQAYYIWENFLLTRKITTTMGKSTIQIYDRVENPGFTTTPFEFLYHINIGFPIVDESSRLLFPSIGVTPRDDVAAAGLDHWNQLSAPIREYEEQVFEHEMVADEEAWVTIAVVNEALSDGLGIYFRYDQRAFPYFTQWKQMGEGAYVVGLEPGNCHVQGRQMERERGTLQFLEPGETREFHSEFGILEGLAAIENLESEINRLKGSKE